MAKKNATITPNDLAESLAGAANREKYGKRVRSFLRSTFPRNVKNVSWMLDATGVEVATVRAWHKARVDGKNFDADAFVKSYRSRKRAPKVTATPTANVPTPTP